jgi:hypothetical protein
VTENHEDFAYLQHVFDETRIVKRPTHGIVTGFHRLSYILLGDLRERKDRSLEIRGQINVSPRFVWHPNYPGIRYEELFGEDNIESALVGRVFGFLAFRGKRVNFESEYLKVKETEMHTEQLIEAVLDELERKEDIETGVVHTPDVRFFPVSIERFIASIIGEELGM